MKIYFVRHGQTVKNKEKLLQGRSNSPLDPSGIRQAESVRDYFVREGVSFDRVYSSPLYRAEATARIIAGDKVELIKNDLLLEMDYGPYEGISLESPPPEIVYFFKDFINHPAPDGMEDLTSVTARLGRFLESIKSITAEHVLVATHAIAMKGALEYLTPESKGSYWSKYIGNCAVYQTELVQEKYTIPEELVIMG